MRRTVFFPNGVIKIKGYRVAGFHYDDWGKKKDIYYDFYTPKALDRVVKKFLCQQKAVF